MALDKSAVGGILGMSGSAKAAYLGGVMNNWGKYTLAVVTITVAGFYCTRVPHGTIPADLRDAVADNAKSRDFDTAIPVIGKDSGDITVPKAAVPVRIDKSYVAGNDSSAGAPSMPLKWITIPGGKFVMGTDSVEKGFENARPLHEVSIKTFAMSKTAVTVEQYAECVIKGVCTEPGAGRGGYCNWGVEGRRLHPVNCVTWDQANDYARFKGGRLPSESEWEYAATSGGKNQKYPWGNEEPIPCREAVMYGYGKDGCGKGSTMPVCSKTAGNTAQGLCDMAGNVLQWVQDKYQGSYKGAPADGGAFEGAGSDDRVMRGSPFDNNIDANLRADRRYNGGPGYSRVIVGFRLARSR